MGRRYPFGIEWLPSRGMLNILQRWLDLIRTNQGLSIDKKLYSEMKTDGYNGMSVGKGVRLIWKFKKMYAWSKWLDVLSLTCYVLGCRMKSPLLICSPFRLYQVLKVRNFCFMGLCRFPGASNHLKSEVLLELLSPSTLMAVVTVENFMTVQLKSLHRSSWFQ